AAARGRRAEALASATMVGAYSAASGSGPAKDMTATPVNAHRPTGRAAPVARGRSALVPVMRVRNAVTGVSYDQPPPADEAGALGVVPPPGGAIDGPAGRTRPRLAPKR